MVRETSIECYNTIKSNGLLSGRRMKVYNQIFNHGPCTASSVFKALGMKTNQSGGFTELKKAGVIRQIGKTEDADTGMKVTLWDVTNQLPEKYKEVDRKKWKEVVLNLISSLDISDIEFDQKINRIKETIQQEL